MIFFINNVIINMIPADILDIVNLDKSQYLVSSIKKKRDVISSPYPILCSYDNKRTQFNNYAIDNINHALYGFDLRDSGLIVAGGIFTSSSTTITSTSTSTSDIDVFVVANDEENAMENVNKLILHIKKQINIHMDTKHEPMLYINPTSITIKNDYIQFPVQIITIRYYSTSMDVINDFDLGSSMIFYDGYDIYTNSLGKFALEYGVNIINFNKIHNSTNKRLLKYYYRGYSIMLPHLNVNKLCYFQQKINDTPSCTTKYHGVKINRDVYVEIISPPIDNIIKCKPFFDLRDSSDSNYSLPVILYHKGILNIYSLLSDKYFINECIKLSEFVSVYERVRISYNLELNETSKLYLLLLTSGSVSVDSMNSLNLTDAIDIIKKLITPDKEFHTIHFNDRKIKETLPKNVDKSVWYGDFMRND